MISSSNKEFKMFKILCLMIEHFFFPVNGISIPDQKKPHKTLNIEFSVISTNAVGVSSLCNG